MYDEMSYYHYSSIHPPKHAVVLHTARLQFDKKNAYDHNQSTLTSQANYKTHYSSSTLFKISK